MDERIKKIIMYIAQHAESESIWLYVNPAWTVNAHETLREIARVFSISEEEMASTVERFAKERED